MQSVVAKQARAMLDLVRRCRFVFTAIITRMNSKRTGENIHDSFDDESSVHTWEIFVGLRG